MSNLGGACYGNFIGEQTLIAARAAVGHLRSFEALGKARLTDEIVQPVGLPSFVPP